MSLKKLKVADLRVGMFLHRFDGPWLSHPFWKSKFLLTRQSDVIAAHNSNIAECWIDTARGADIAVVAPAVAMPAAQPELDAPPGKNSLEPVPFQQELQRAADLCRDARSATESMFNEARLGNAIDTEACLPLVNEISDSVSRNPQALITLARLKHSDDYTYMHSVAVCALMVALAQAMDMDEAGCREAGLAGLLHDIGKAHVPLDILNKPGKLTDDEFAVMRLHPEQGHQVLRQDPSASAVVLDVCLHHHEKVDGSGYPHRLQGEQISLMARMGAICDVYDAITSDRPYKPGWDPAESVARMISWKGHFDHAILSAFIKILGIYPTGALVKMRSGRVGVVVEQNPGMLTKPIVKLLPRPGSAGDSGVERIDLGLASETDTIVGREPRTHWDAAMIDALWAGDLAQRRG